MVLLLCRERQVAGEASGPVITIRARYPARHQCYTICRQRESGRPTNVTARNPACEIDGKVEVETTSAANEAGARAWVAGTLVFTHPAGSAAR